MKVLVVGASRGSGAQAVVELAARGHQVTALARSEPDAAVRDTPGVAVLRGDALDPCVLAGAVADQEAVLVTLGISENPLAVRFGRTRTPIDVRSAGTSAVVEAMRDAGVRRLVVQTTYGLGDSYRRLTWAYKLFFALVLRPQVHDSAVQEQVVTGSGLEWTLVRPVALHDGHDPAVAHVAVDDEIVGMRVSRGQLAGALADVVTDPGAGGRTLSVSAA